MTEAASAIGTQYARQALRDVMEDAAWANLSAESGMPIIRRTDILGGPGSSVTIPVTSKLVGAGRTEVQTMVGNEDPLVVSNVVLTPSFTRNAVLIDRLAQMRSSIDLYDEAKFRLAEWGRETVDAARFSSFSNASVPASPNVYYQGTGHSAINQITTSDKMSVDGVRQVRKALVTNGAVPMRTRNGAPLFGMFINPQNEYDLKTDTLFNTAIVQAGERGLDNPWLNGSLGVIDGVALFVDRGVVRGADGAGGIGVSRNLAFGQEAFVEAWAEDAFWADDFFDYKQQHGASFGFSFACQRSPVKKNSLIAYFYSV